MKTCWPLLLLLLGPALLRADEPTRQVQSALKDAGFYFGELSGETNEETTGALRRFQIRNGLEVTGTVNDETVAALKVTGGGPPFDLPEQITAPSPTPAPGPAVAPAPAPTPGGEKTGPPRAPREIQVVPPGDRSAAALRRVFAGTSWENAPRQEQSVRLAKAQSQLKRLGYYQQIPDGLPGPATEEALLRFQSANRLSLTGRLDPVTVRVLNTASTSVKPRTSTPPANRPEGPVLKGYWVH